MTGIIEQLARNCT